jgi:hypothetical protein
VPVLYFGPEGCGPSSPGGGSQSGSASAKRLEIWRQLVPLRFADEYDEEIEAVTAGTDAAVDGLGERLTMCGGWLRRLLAGLVIKQLSTPAVYGGECWQRSGRVEGFLSECHDTELSPF